MKSAPSRKHRILGVVPSFVLARIVSCPVLRWLNFDDLRKLSREEEDSVWHGEDESKEEGMRIKQESRRSRGLLIHKR